MKIVLLTTDTPHHTYFAWRINEIFPLQAIFLEANGIRPRFETTHPFENLRDEYEYKVLLRGIKRSINDIISTRIFGSMNDDACISELDRLKPDIVIVFGTGKLQLPVIEVASFACLNLHGGNPERYRGLDTRLWSIYHNDFGDLVTTLHHVDADLDTGDIVFQSKLKVEAGTRLHQLRAINTKVCVNLFFVALGAFQSIGWLPSREQISYGRYYSYMPAVLKEECIRKFNRYVTGL